MTQLSGAYAVAWDQVQLNGAAASAEALAPGAVWQWQGDAVRLNGPSDVLVLETPVEDDDTRRRVALKLGTALDQGSDGPPEDGFVLTDARRRWHGRVIARPGGGALCVFDGGLPPAGVPLWVVSDHRRPTPRSARASGIVTGAAVQTPDGPVAVETLFPGDQVQGAADCWHEVLWIGRRALSGAQLWAEPDLAPVRVLAGALGHRAPGCDLLVAPDHHLSVHTARARALYGSETVLVRARDLLDSGRALRVMAGGGVTYVSLGVERHGLIEMMGAQVESFHPLTHDRATATPDDMGRLAAILPEATDDPDGFGPLAARCLSRAEAAILFGG